MSERSERVFREYIAGASLAFGLVLLTFQTVSAYFGYSGRGWEGLSGYSDTFFALFLGVHITGGVLSGYLVGRRREEKTVQAGVVTAVLAYIIEYIYYIIFERAFPGSLWALIGFVGGGAFGAYLATIQRYRGRLRSSLAHAQPNHEIKPSG